MRLTLLDTVLEALRADPEREALEGVLLLLVGEGRLPLERAGEILGFEDREEAMRWYAKRTLPYPDLATDDSGEIGEIVYLEDLTQKELDRSNKFIRIIPAEKGSDLSDVSINYDKHLYEDDRR